MNGDAGARTIDFDVQAAWMRRFNSDAESNLRAFAGLTGSVIISGAGEAIEIWDAATYAAQLAQEDAAYRQTLGADE